MRFGGISTEILVWSLMVIIIIIMIITVYCRFIFIRRLIKDKHFSSSLAWPCESRGRPPYWPRGRRPRRILTAGAIAPVAPEKSAPMQRTPSETNSAVAKRPRDASCLSVVSFNILTAQFLPCDVMHSAAIAGMRCLSVRPSVYLSVRLSVTFVSCAKTNKNIFEIFTPCGSQAILVFPHQTGWRYSHGNSPKGGKGGMKKLTIFDQYLAVSQKRL